MPKLLPVGGFGFVKASNIAKTFFDVAGIVEPYQKLAIEQLIYNLCNFGLWDKVVALYPMIGGTALAHSFNLKNLVNHNLIFFGGWTHSATGAKPNGINGYANTNLPHNAPEIEFNGSYLNRHFSYYSRTQSAASGVLLGINDGGAVINYLYPNPLTSALSGNAIFAGSTNTQGLLAATMVQTNRADYYTNGTLLQMSAFGTIGTTIDPYFLGASNQLSGTAGLFSDCECSFSSIGLGLTFNELNVLKGIVEDFVIAKNAAI